MKSCSIGIVCHEGNKNENHHVTPLHTRYGGCNLTHTQAVTSTGKDVVTLESSYLADGDIKWGTYCGKLLQNTRHRATPWPNTSLLDGMKSNKRMKGKKKRSVYPQWRLHTNTQRRMARKTGNNPTLINRPTDQQHVIYPHNGKQYLAIKRNAVLIRTTAQMNLGNSLLLWGHERPQS